VALGTQLGPCRIEGSRGAGGMGEVFHAIDTRLGRPVAIKIVQQQFSACFEREARAISSLNHPHICTVHDVGKIAAHAGRRTGRHALDRTDSELS
jgi:serine/threonine protein kinase